MKSSSKTTRNYVLNLLKREWRFVFSSCLSSLGNCAYKPITNLHLMLLITILPTWRFDQGRPLDVLEIGSGTGNLAETLLNNSQKTLNYMGMLTISLSICQQLALLMWWIHAVYIQEDAVRPHSQREWCYYQWPTCWVIPKWCRDRESCSHGGRQLVKLHLLYHLHGANHCLKKDGIATSSNQLIFDKPTKWLCLRNGYQDMLILPLSLFQKQLGNKHNMKSIFKA